MKILKDITIDSYLNLLNSDNNTFRKYYSEDMDFDSEVYRSLFTQEELMLDILGIEDLNAPELIISSDPKNDFENSKITYEWLKNLSISEANDSRFWTTLTHLNYEKYTRFRWKIDKKTTNGTIKQRYFYTGAGLQARLRNAISRLWWIAKLTVREDLPDKYIYTDIVWSSQDLMQNLFERSLGTYPNIRFGILEFFLQRKLIYDSKQFRVFYKEINALGAMSPLGLLSENEVIEFLLKVEKSYYPDLIIKDKMIREYESPNETTTLKRTTKTTNSFKDLENLLSINDEMSKEKNYKFFNAVSTLNESNEPKKELINRSGIYVKKINSQDIERTPSISTEAVSKFLQINLINDEEIEFICNFNGIDLAIELKKRNTREEYRLFINKYREQIGYDKNDLLVFEYKSGKLNLEIIKETFTISQNPKYNDYNMRLGNKFHLLL
jgi:hypothetical protein